MTNIINIRHRTTKKSLPLFSINLAPADNNKEIYSVNRLLNTVVKFEPPIPKKDIPQCSKCQHFGHTKSYCKRIPRCVKCLLAHKTEDCTRNVKDNNVKCVNCNGDHPANYKGCEVYKAIKAKMYPPQREKDIPSKNFQYNFNSANTKPNFSYADATKQNSQHKANNEELTQTNDIKELKTMMKDLMSQMSTMLNLLTVLVSKMT